MRLRAEPTTLGGAEQYDPDRTTHHGAGTWRHIRNGLPCPKPYHYRAKDSEREAEIAAIVAAIRQQAAANIASQDALMAQEWPRKGAQ